ncbi:MCM DNA helicase complex subunit [Acarospora aff. strigata]|nr:MCM DNA helicase complex subunit [Acarospora aff. strigata]
MDGLQLRDEAVRDRIRAAEEFLDPTDARARSYRADIILMLNRGLRRLIVSLDEIRAHNRALAEGLLQSPFDHVQAFDQALKNIITTLPNRPAKETSDDAVSFPEITRNLIIMND